MVEYHPIAAKDLSRLHQFGKKVLPGIFLGYVLYAGGFWKGDIMVADIEELDKMDASEIHARRLNAKEVLTPKNWWTFYVSDRRWNSQIIWRRSGSENIHLNQGQPAPRRRTRKSSRRIRRVFTTTSRLIAGCWWSKPERLNDSGPFQGTTFTVITLNRESNCTCREKNHSQFHYDTSNVTRATSTTLDVMLERRTDDYWNIEGDRDVSDSWTGFTRFTILDGKPPMGIHGLGSGWRRSKRHPGPITGQKNGKPEAYEKNKRLSKNQSLTILEGCEVITSLIQQMRSSKKLLNMRGESWKFRCQQLCFARPGEENTRKLVALLMHSQDKIRMHRWSRRIHEKAFGRNSTQTIMKTTLQEKESIIEPLQSREQVFPMPEAMKTADAEAAVDKEWDTGKTRTEHEAKTVHFADGQLKRVGTQFQKNTELVLINCESDSMQKQGSLRHKWRLQK